MNWQQETDAPNFVTSSVITRIRQSRNNYLTALTKARDRRPRLDGQELQNRTDDSDNDDDDTQKTTLRREKTRTQERTLSQLIPYLGHKRNGLRQLSLLGQDGKRWFFGNPLITIELRVEIPVVNIYLGWILKNFSVYDAELQTPPLSATSEWVRPHHPAPAGDVPVCVWAPPPESTDLEVHSVSGHLIEAVNTLPSAAFSSLPAPVLVSGDASNNLPDVCDRLDVIDRLICYILIPGFRLNRISSEGSIPVLKLRNPCVGEARWSLDEYVRDKSSSIEKKTR
uniref:Uncharacterized protein n=1 Tax=Timema bartmani TaxID=61472 RepID=A0A7R9F9K5_9NEOP|nr:unnamed protein product [Timema bartmani]